MHTVSFHNLLVYVHVCFFTVLCCLRFDMIGWETQKQKSVLGVPGRFLGGLQGLVTEPGKSGICCSC